MFADFDLILSSATAVICDQAVDVWPEMAYTLGMTWRDRWVCVLLLVTLGVAGCSEKTAKKTPSASAGAQDVAPASEPSADVPADVAFLIAACEDSGLPTEACACVGNSAKTALKGELLAKMAKAPADDAPALENYYAGAEIQTIMAWVESSSSECGI